MTPPGEDRWFYGELLLDCWLMAAKAITEAERDESARQMAAWIRRGDGLTTPPGVRYRCCQIATETRTGSMTLAGFLGRARHLERLFVEDEERSREVRSPGTRSGRRPGARPKAGSKASR